MSRFEIFAFVEGWTDRYFYDKLCQFAFREAHFTYQVRTSEELSSPNKGKIALLELFSYLRRRKLLFHEFKGKKLAVIFFLDKDLDDYLRVRKRSKHIVYTEYYSVENHLFRHSDLVDLAAAAAGLDAYSIGHVLGDQEAWLLGAASEWKDWIKLCFLTRVIGVNCRPNYGLHSQVNRGAYGGIIAGSVPQMMVEIQAASGLPDPQFGLIAQRTSRAVDRTFAKGQQDRVFKGKWYGIFLAEDVRRAAAGRPYNANGLETRALAIATSKWDFASPWAEHFVGPIREVIAMF